MVGVGRTPRSVKEEAGRPSFLQPPPAKEPTAVEHLHVKIPLKPQERPVAFPQNFADTLKEEYAIKYLQRLGADSTPDNVATVLKHLPFDDCQITSAWKVRGSLADVVMVDLYPKPNNNPRLVPESSSPGDMAFTQHFPTAEADESKELLATCKPYRVGCVCMSFDDMKRQYLLPFKHGTRDEADVLTMYAMKHEEPVPLMRVPVLSEIHTKPALQLFGRRATQRRIKCIEERAKPPEVRPDFVKQILRSFHGALPFSLLGIRRDLEIIKLYQLLDNPEVADLIDACVRYLYLEVFFKLGCLGAADLVKTSTLKAYQSESPAVIEQLYVLVIQLFSSIKHRMKREDKGLVLFLPLHLLALRVAVQTVFRCQYPVSFSVTGPTMQYILGEMDEQITKVLDGDQLLSRIGILETTCESTRVMSSHPFQARRRRSHLRDHFYLTSDAINTIFPDPKSGKCRKMIKFRGSAAIANYPRSAVSCGKSEQINGNTDVYPSDQACGGNEGWARLPTLPRASLETRLQLLRLKEHCMKGLAPKTVNSAR